MEEKYKFLFVQGTRFTTDDLNDALVCYEYRTQDTSFYSLSDPFANGPALTFCMENRITGEKFFKFFWYPQKWFKREEFLAIGNNPNLLVLL